MTVFEGEPRCHIDICFCIQNKTIFLNTKSKLFFNITLFEGGSRCQTKNRHLRQIQSRLLLPES
jgi:hypothetical protein